MYQRKLIPSRTVAVVENGGSNPSISTILFKKDENKFGEVQKRFYLCTIRKRPVDDRPRELINSWLDSGQSVENRLLVRDCDDSDAVDDDRQFSFFFVRLV